MELRSDSCVVRLNEATGALVSARATHAPGRELLVEGHGDYPLFVLQYLDEAGRVRQVSPGIASRIDRSRFSYEDVGGTSISAVATVRTVSGDPAVYFDFAATLPRSTRLLSVQYPFVVARYDLPGAKLLRPFMEGRLYESPRPRHFPPDAPHLWHFEPRNGESMHYPGQTFAQLLAYYGDDAGLLLSCRDASGQPKQIRPAHRDAGVRLGVSHVVGWTEPGEHDLGYSTALEGFAGDWYDAAERYRSWALGQPWAATRLAERNDLPEWLADSPFHVPMRIQGELDSGPVTTHPEFTPYENALPLLERVAERLDAPLVPVVMAWERPGPWVYPDCFPPAGGAASLARFAAAARTRGWHVGTYCNGTRWSTAHFWTGYDGEAYFEANGGPDSVCRLPDGRLWPSGWDQHWRPSYLGCVGAERTGQLLRDYAETLLGYGLDWIQILDQNVGANAFPCYSAEHGHPPAPGRWMTEGMDRLIEGVRELGERAPGEVVWAVEGACAECHLPQFVICDVRPDPRVGAVPLFHFLYHDRVLTQSIFAPAPNPYFLLLKCARSFVLGDVLGACIGKGGRLQNWEPPPGEPWMEWDAPAGDQDGVYAMLRSALALRRDVGRDFLTFGQMLRPVSVEGIESVEWMHAGQLQRAPSVEHATWRALDGRTAVALANWTEEPRSVRVDMPAATAHLAVDGAVEPRSLGVAGELLLPARACALLVV